ncbi:MAG TPA: zinc metallopeptidase [Vicinamibacterales bacterium]|nr:zinc metallopeptidase [Vicinamibacterales bacterium]
MEQPAALAKEGAHGVRHPVSPVHPAGIVASGWASARTKAAFPKYSQAPTTRGLTGTEAAGQLLARAGIGDAGSNPLTGS